VARAITLVSSVVVATILVGAAPLSAAPPSTYAELKAALPESKKARIKQLARFADGGHAALDDRIQAARALAREQEDSERWQAEAILVEARLHGLVRSGKSRRRALQKARAVGSKYPAVTSFVDKALAADKLLSWVTARADKRKPGSRIGPKEGQKLRDLEAAARRAYARKDPVRLGWARYEIARVRARSDEQEPALRALNKLLRVGGNKRDGAPVRAAVRRLRSTLLAGEDRIKDAVRESIIADRLAMAPLTKPASYAETRGVHTRSRQTMELCLKSKRERGVDCGQIVSGERGYYDFSVEQSHGGFDELRAEAVAVEYGDLIPKCLKKYARHLRGTTVQLDWTVGHDGRVKGGHVYRPRRMRRTPFEKCVKEAFELYRYPRYGGEIHSLAMEFYVEERR
jgi:hypothetical protein